MAEYESDLTRFIREMKQKRPDLERRQREAREIWWNKSLDLDEQERFAQSRVRMAGYVYQTKPKLSP
jgi:Protein of unknown function (DUF3460)